MSALLDCFSLPLFAMLFLYLIIPNFGVSHWSKTRVVHTLQRLSTTARVHEEVAPSEEWSDHVNQMRQGNVTTVAQQDVEARPWVSPLSTPLRAWLSSPLTCPLPPIELLRHLFLRDVIKWLIALWVMKIYHQLSDRERSDPPRPPMTRASPPPRRPMVVLLLGLALAFCLAVLSIQSSSFTGLRAARRLDLVADEVRALSGFQSRVQQCVANRGLGLTADIIDHCKLVLKFPKGTNSTWYNAQFKIFEPLEYKYDVCETILLWEQYRNMTTVLTREYLDVRPDGWLDYAAKRIAQLGVDKCYNRTLCEELLSVLLPAKPPFHPRQFATCAVVGNSGDLLKTEFGREIDAHDAVFRDNEAPVTEKYAKYVGLKRDFRLVVRGAARNMAAILKGSSDEVLIIKSLTHKEINAMIKELPNPVYLFQGIVLRRGAKGTGMKSIELALSMCDIVDMYGFTVDPGYTEWTRYFSSPRKGHNPLQGRAYYQLLECLGVIRIHSPMRAQRVEDWSDIPRKEEIRRAHAATFRLKRHETGQADVLGPFSNCKVWGTVDPDHGPESGTSDMSETRRNSNYSKWELLPFENLRREAQEHLLQMGGVSLYKMDGNKLDDIVCVRHEHSSTSDSST